MKIQDVETFEKENHFRLLEDCEIFESEDAIVIPKICQQCENSEARYSDWCKFTGNPVEFNGHCDRWELLRHEKHYR